MQSAVAPHVSPLGHGSQSGPPQSTPVSVESLRLFLQLALTHLVPLLHAWPAMQPVFIASSRHLTHAWPASQTPVLHTVPGAAGACSQTPFLHATVSQSAGVPQYVSSAHAEH